MTLRHVIWHGDSIELCRNIKGNKINCIITDPPFGVDNQSNMAVTQSGKEYARKIANDESPEKALEVFEAVMDSLLPRTAPDCDMYVFTSGQVLKEWLHALDELVVRHDFVRKGILVWEKDGPGMGDLDSWGQAHEYILFFKKGRKPREGVRSSGVLHFPQVRPNRLIHPHEKPLPLLERLMDFSTKPGEFIVDPFGGSGSTVRAAKRCGRSALGIEYDQKNWEIATKALEEQEDNLFA